MRTRGSRQRSRKSRTTMSGLALVSSIGPPTGRNRDGAATPRKECARDYGPLWPLLSSGLGFLALVKEREEAHPEGEGQERVAYDAKGDTPLNEIGDVGLGLRLHKSPGRVGQGHHQPGDGDVPAVEDDAQHGEPRPENEVEGVTAEAGDEEEDHGDDNTQDHLSYPKPEAIGRLLVEQEEGLAGGRAAPIVADGRQIPELDVGVKQKAKSAESGDSVQDVVRDGPPPGNPFDDIGSRHRPTRAHGDGRDNEHDRHAWREAYRARAEDAVGGPQRRLVDQ